MLPCNVSPMKLYMYMSLFQNKHCHSYVKVYPHYVYSLLKWLLHHPLGRNVAVPAGRKKCCSSTPTADPVCCWSTRWAVSCCCSTRWADSCCWSTRWAVNVLLFQPVGRTEQLVARPHGAVLFTFACRASSDRTLLEMPPREMPGLRRGLPSC